MFNVGEAKPIITTSSSRVSIDTTISMKFIQARPDNGGTLLLLGELFSDGVLRYPTGILLIELGRLYSSIHTAVNFGSGVSRRDLGLGLEAF